MCRHLAYLGPPVTLASLLLDPPQSLEHQSWAPARQEHGTVNADGFGIGWYADWAPRGAVEPARYRRAVPMWADPSFRTIARAVRSGAFLAAVRSATPGQPCGESAAAPFGTGQWLFSHNGTVTGWPESVGVLAGGLSPAELVPLGALTDSTILWALVAQRLAKGLPAAEALVSVVEHAASTAGGRLNLLLTDGETVAATAWGDTLFWRSERDAVVVVSEPYDKRSGWVPVPDRSVLVASRRGVEVGAICGQDSPWQ